MCNLYHMAPRDHVEVYFRAQIPASYVAVAVGPFGMGAFLRAAPGGLELVTGQWGMIAPGSTTRRPASRAILTNNARAESLDERRTYRAAWASGQRCLIPAAWYQEPNWETGKHIPWRMTRADGAPWALAGIWSEWIDPVTGEIVPSYTMITVNCDGHALLGRLHKPDPILPDDARSVVPLEMEQWSVWLSATPGVAKGMLQAPPVERFDLSDARRTDRLLGR
jgi:putative SOS response-associated peptidase YedK